MWDSLLVLAVSLLPSCAIMASIGGVHAVWVSLAILLPVGVIALGLAQLADLGRLPLSALRHRFGLGLALVLGQLALAVVVGAAVMFVSHHDAWATIAILLFAAVVTARVAQLLLRGVERDVLCIQEGLHAVERGERDVRVQAASGGELADLARSANRMIGALDSEERARDGAEVARRQVIAAISHDLRTPLTSLRLLTEALDDELVDAATARRYVRTMGTQVRTLGTLIDDLFELSRLDAGDFAWSTETVHLSSLVRETIAILEPETEAAGIAVSVELPFDLAPARANPDKLRRVLLNLLQNAIHHTPPDGSVMVRATPSEAGVEIEVSDTGAGICAGDRPHVFEPFYRGSGDPARSGAGSGLGLAISRAIVEAHGGRIWLADASAGTDVRFTLPLAVG